MPWPPGEVLGTSPTFPAGVTPPEEPPSALDSHLMSLSRERGSINEHFDPNFGEIPEGCRAAGTGARGRRPVQLCFAAGQGSTTWHFAPHRGGPELPTSCGWWEQSLGVCRPSTESRAVLRCPIFGPDISLCREAIRDQAQLRVLFGTRGCPPGMKVCVSLVNYILDVVRVTPVLFFLPASVQRFGLGSLCRVKTDAARRPESCLLGVASSRSGNKVAASPLSLAVAGFPRNWCHRQERLHQGAPLVCFLPQAGPYCKSCCSEQLRKTQRSDRSSHWPVISSNIHLIQILV